MSVNGNGSAVASYGSVKETPSVGAVSVAGSPAFRKHEVSAQIAALKRSPVYKSLDPGPQKLAVYMLRRFANGSGLMIPGQGKTLAPGLKRSRQTINVWLRELVLAEVFTSAKRYRGKGTKGGRTTNVYELNAACLDGPLDTTPDITADSTFDSGSSKEQFEPTAEIEPTAGIETLTGAGTSNGSGLDSSSQTTNPQGQEHEDESVGEGFEDLPRPRLLCPICGLDFGVPGRGVAKLEEHVYVSHDGPLPAAYRDADARAA